MCGIIGVIRRRDLRQRPTVDQLVDPLTAAIAVLNSEDTYVERFRQAAELAESVNARLLPAAGVEVLVNDRRLASTVADHTRTLSELLAAMERELEAVDFEGSGTLLERTNAQLIRLRDALWAISRDRLRAATGVLLLGGEGLSAAAAAAYFSIHQALSALDRMEVRGRDSAGIQVLVSGHGLNLDDAELRRTLDARMDATFCSGAVAVEAGNLIFVYKAAFEIGELGDNSAVMREAIRNDQLLAMALENSDAEAVVLGHTRWASIGIISEPNAHPQSSFEPHRATPFVSAVLNGDVDNHVDLHAAFDLDIPANITTDAKVIPTLVARRLADGMDPADAFRETVASLIGSVAIGVSRGEDPTCLQLALRGSGQALYIGLAEDAYIVASEPYGVVEETTRYLRMDGETPSNPDNPTGSRGQILVLDRAAAGTIEGIGRWSYDGTELPVREGDLATAEITTRDIDRGEFPHFLLKEITDAPGSFRKTLRGKLIEHEGRFNVVLGEETIPSDVRDGLADGSIRRVEVIGQGTAAVAGQSLALALSDMVTDAQLVVDVLPATELSGFRMRADMSDTLIIAISQSGTTTDTNRTVDLVRGRGARVISIVNRRQSDLCDKSDGVMYTSDGRDVEMSVASTKAFYSQIAAGMLLAVGLSEYIPDAVHVDSDSQQALLSALAGLPALMETTIARRPEIAAPAHEFFPSRRYWAIVGNGPNQIAAREIRIKLSELCYKSIACDATEDKKHIDLSSEPAILVCAAGLVGSTADDVAKEVAIYRAHKAAPVVIASEGGSTFSSALAVITVPATDARLAFILSAVVGHLFGYEAALAIDAQARPLREIRAGIEHLVTRHAEELRTGALDDELLAATRTEITPHAAAFFDGLRASSYDGHLEAGTAVRLATLLRFALGHVHLDAYQIEFGKIGTPGVVLDDLTAALTDAIEELTRPIDAIKHQAKTVTVGISRSDESLLTIPLVAATIAAGAARDRLAYSTLRSLADLDAAVSEIVGYTRYRVDRAASEDGMISVIDRGGIALGLTSRTDKDGRLRGTKHLVAREAELMVAQGRSDGRTVVIIPEIKDGDTTGLTLLHVNISDVLPTATIRGVLRGYRRRYQALKDAVTETEDVFRDDLLGDVPVVDLLCEPILDLADRWRS